MPRKNYIERPKQKHKMPKWLNQWQMEQRNKRKKKNKRKSQKNDMHSQQRAEAQ